MAGNSILIVILLSCFFAIALSQTPCNGNAKLCSRQYSNVTQIGTHDSAFVGVGPSDNQDLSVTDQLNAGIRFLQAQTHLDLLGTLSLCHTSCFLRYAGPLESYLAEVKGWLDSHPNEVLTLLLTNGDSVNVDLFGTAFQDSGITKYMFTPPSNNEALDIDAWPTLQDLIDADTRVVAFLDYDANTNAVPYLLNEFDYFFETPFDTVDPAFRECTLDRPAGASPDGRMYIVNHFLDVKVGSVLVPDQLQDSKTNAATGSGSVGAQADLCTSMYGRRPNFVLVDFFERGQVFLAQDTLNGL